LWYEKIRFPGQYYGQEIGLHYNYHRYYDPKTGRYLTPDPIGLVGGINLFAYGLNSPANEIDPLGLWSPKAHDALIQNAFEGLLPQNEIERLKASGRAFDKRTQDPSQSYMHSMRRKDQTTTDAISESDRFTKETIQRVRCEKDRNKALDLFGELIHPIMDSFSPQHTDEKGSPRIWTPWWPFGHSPNEFIGNETVKDITPEIYKKNKEALIEARVRRVVGPS